MLTRVSPDGALALRVVLRMGDDMTFMLTQASLIGLQMTVPTETGMAKDKDTAGRLAALYADLGVSSGAEVIERLASLSGEAREALVNLLKGGA